MQALLLDDDQYTVACLSDMLRALGVSDLLSANNGEEGVVLLDHAITKPDMLFCDLSMPYMDGIEFLRQLAQRQYRGRVILMSGHQSFLLKSAHILARRYGLNAIAALRKPIGLNDLADVIARPDVS